jgi:hypothetical protein
MIMTEKQQAARTSALTAATPSNPSLADGTGEPVLHMGETRVLHVVILHSVSRPATQEYLLH